MNSSTALIYALKATHSLNHSSNICFLLMGMTDVAGEAAAASAKAQKKLRKLQGIASQAEQAHAGIIVDEEVLEGSDSDENEADETAGAEGGSRAVHRSSTGSSGSEQDKRKGPGKAAAASTAAPGRCRGAE